MSEENKKAQSRRRRRGSSSIVTKESVCAVFAVFSLLSFLILCTNDALFGDIGSAIFGFLTGVFGYMAYPVLLAFFYLSCMGLIGKRLVKNRKAGTCIVFTVITIALIVHSATTYTWDLGGDYLAKCFEAPTYEIAPFITVGGIIGALPVYGLAKLVTMVGTLIILSSLALLFAYLSYVSLFGAPTSGKSKEKKVKKGKDKDVDIPVEIPLMQQPTPLKPTPVQPTPLKPNATKTQVSVPQQPGVVIGSGDARAFSPFGGAQHEGMPSSLDERRKFLFDKDPAQQYKDNLIFDPTAKVNTLPTYGQPTSMSYTDAYQNSINQPVKPEKIVTNYASPTYTAPVERTVVTPPPTPTPTPTYVPVDELDKEVTKPSYLDEQPRDFRDEDHSRDDREDRRDYSNLFPEESSRDLPSSTETRGRYDETDYRGVEYREDSRIGESDERGRAGMDLFDEDDDPYSLRDDFSDGRRGGFESERGKTDDFRRDDGLLSNSRSWGDDFLTPSRGADRGFTSQPTPVVKPSPTPEPPKPRIIRPYVQPRLDDFTCTDLQPIHNPEDEEEIKNNIITTLADFKINDATVVSTTHGPTVTRYNVSIPRDISPQKVLSLDQRIAMSLHSSLISVLPNYDSGTISIEVPNKNRQFVNLGSMLSGDTFVNAKSSSLMFAMGKDVSNAKVYGDLSKMVHLLVAGGTGGGKSVFLGAMIMSLIYKYSPQEMRLILIDPKRTEFSLYYNLPHLMINEIITDSKKTVRALSWAEAEMNRRYELISQMTKAGKFVQNIDQYNANVEKENKLPKLVIIIDELADLMLTSERKEIEDRIQSLTQKARAAGIHVVVATQRPSTNVITGVIKTNLVTRIAFSVPTDIDSRVILDNSGAQNLCGLGDMLYFISGMKTPVRVQSAFVSNEEAQRIVNYIKENNDAYYDEDATAYINDERGGSVGGESSMDEGEDFDPVYIQALRYVISCNTASISMIQRKFPVGYNKAGRIIDWMDNKGYITPFDGAKARKVLITQEQFEELYGSF